MHMTDTISADSGEIVSLQGTSLTLRVKERKREAEMFYSVDTHLTICQRLSPFYFSFLVACYATLHPALSVPPSVRRSIHPSVRRSVRHTLLLFGFCGLWPHRTCPNDEVTSIKAPAHPHATGVAVYPALFHLIPSLFYNESGVF